MLFVLPWLGVHCAEQDALIFVALIGKEHLSSNISAYLHTVYDNRMRSYFNDESKVCYV